MSERTIKGQVNAKWTSTDIYKDGYDRIFGAKEAPKSFEDAVLKTPKTLRELIAELNKLDPAMLDLTLNHVDFTKDSDGLIVGYVQVDNSIIVFGTQHARKNHL